MEPILQLFAELKAKLDALSVQLADAQAAADQIAKESYDKGFLDGVASVPPNGDKLYTQAEADALVLAAVAPLTEQVAVLQVQVDGIPALIASEVAKAKEELKALMMAAYDEAQAAEGSLESGLKDKLAAL